SYRMDYENYNSAFQSQLPANLNPNDIYAKLTKIRRNIHSAHLNQHKLFTKFFNGYIMELHKLRFDLQQDLRNELNRVWNKD
ncbi:hypothetical protein, partial [Photobacterium halotolerans]|uniref:hypothetical protein n=1 Tax=Photobacterium halotolerans TaxID=265726 RepID=UPI001F2FEFFE